MELGASVQPAEAYVRYEHGAYLDAWYTRLRDAYMATMADLGVTTGMPDDAFLAAMARHKDRDPGQAAVLSAIKSSVKGGIGKLRERPQGIGYQYGERWPALERPTWSPHIRAELIGKARTNMHRKRLFDAQAAGASEQQLQNIAAEGLQEFYFKDRGRRADGLQVEFTDIDYVEMDF
ncbi:hypothetical protein ACWCV5_27470 [Streptomyces tubercidicus]